MITRRNALRYWKELNQLKELCLAYPRLTPSTIISMLTAGPVDGFSPKVMHLDGLRGIGMVHIDSLLAHAIKFMSEEDKEMAMIYKLSNYQEMGDQE